MIRPLVALILATLACAAQAQAPATGAGTWKYSYADQQYGRHRTTFSVRSNGEDADGRSGKYLVRSLEGGKMLPEYFPHALADGAPPATWPVPSGYPTYATPYLEWTYTVKAVGWESVTVPAGTFRALRVEIEGNRGKDPDPFWWPKQAARFVHTVWYAPEAKRYVKARHQAWSMTSSLFADDAVDLLEVRAD